MSSYLTPLLQFQRFFLPALFILLGWAIWRTVWRKDSAVGLALYLGLVIVVDSFLNTGIYLPGLGTGSIRYSELCAVFLLINRPPAPSECSLLRTVKYLVGFYFALLFLSALGSDPMLAGIFEFRRLMIPQIIAFLVATRGLGSREDYRRFFLCLIALAIIMGLFVFWDVFFDRWLLKSEMLFKPEYYMNRKQGRFGGVFLNPNFLGAFVVLVFPPAFVWTLNEHQRGWRLFAWTGLLALVFSLVQTQSRGPLLAFGLALLMLAFGPFPGLSRYDDSVSSLSLSFYSLFLCPDSSSMRPNDSRRSTMRSRKLRRRVRLTGSTRGVLLRTIHSVASVLANSNFRGPWMITVTRRATAGCTTTLTILTYR